MGGRGGMGTSKWKSPSPSAISPRPPSSAADRRWTAPARGQGPRADAHTCPSRHGHLLVASDGVRRTARAKSRVYSWCRPLHPGPMTETRDDGAPAATRTSLRRRLARPLIALLTQGHTPEKIALSVAFGIALGLFPIFGTTTLLCVLAGVLLRLNHPAIQVS